MNMAAHLRGHAHAVRMRIAWSTTGARRVLIGVGGGGQKSLGVCRRINLVTRLRSHAHADSVRLLGIPIVPPCRDCAVHPAAWAHLAQAHLAKVVVRDIAQYFKVDSVLLKEFDEVAERALLEPRADVLGVGERGGEKGVGVGARLARSPGTRLSRRVRMSYG
jgi:hypothetical protein